MPVLFVNNCATLLDDTYETEYLASPFEMMKYGETVDMTPRNLGGDRGLYVDEEYLPFWWDNGKLYYNIEKYNEEDIEELGRFELKSPTPNDIWETSYLYQMGKKEVPSEIPILELRKVLDMIP